MTWSSKAELTGTTGNVQLTSIAEETTVPCNAKPPPAAGAGEHRPGTDRRVLVSSRKPPTRRVMLNEDEVVQFIRDRCSARCPVLSDIAFHAAKRAENRLQTLLRCHHCSFPRQAQLYDDLIIPSFPPSAVHSSSDTPAQIL